MEMLIGGSWRPAASGRAEEVTSPFDGAVIGTVPVADAGDVRAALGRAEQGALIWRRTPAFERMTILMRAAGLADERTEQIAQIISGEAGKTIAEARGEASRSGDLIRLAAFEGAQLYGEALPLDASRGTGGRRHHVHRLQLPACPGRGAGPRADRGGRARPDHQRARSILQQLRGRAQRRPVLAVPPRPGRQRRARRPAQPRRRPDAVRRGADHRGQLAAVHRVRPAAHLADGIGHPLRRDRERRDGGGRERRLRRGPGPVRRIASRRSRRHPGGVPGQRRPAVRARLRDLRHRGTPRPGTSSR